MSASREPSETNDLRRLIVIAGHRGDRALVEAHLDHIDPGVRTAALGALHRLGRLDAGRIARAVDDRSPIVRRRAAELAASVPGCDLLPFLHDADSDVVEMAAWSAGEVADPSPELVDRLIELASRHDDALIREISVAALGALGDERALPTILSACDDKPTVRRRAVLALAPFDGAEVRAALERAKSDRDWQVRQAAEDLLG